MIDFTELLGSACPVLEIVDVGAMIIQGDARPHVQLARQGRARVVGFEPIQAECDKLNAAADKGVTFLPYFIGDGSTRTFHLARAAMCSSLYPTNTRLVSLFQQLPDLMQTVSTSDVETRRLDDIPEITSIDFLKIDVQGGELDALKGATRHLAGAVVVQTEVEFLPLYEGQPLFADVDSFLRSRGFVLHTMTRPLGRAFKPLLVDNDPNRQLNQVLWADAVYVRDFTNLESLSLDQIHRCAMVLDGLFGSVDLAAVLFRECDRRESTKLSERYMKLVEETMKKLMARRAAGQMYAPR